MLLFSQNNDDIDALKAELNLVNDEITKHSFKSEDIESANKLIETGKKEKKSTFEIDRELVSKNLPTVENIGRTTANGLFAWGKLHRKRKKLEKKISRLEKG